MFPSMCIFETIESILCSNFCNHLYAYLQVIEFIFVFTVCMHTCKWLNPFYAFNTIRPHLQYYLLMFIFHFMSFDRTRSFPRRLQLKRWIIISGSLIMNISRQTMVSWRCILRTILSIVWIIICKYVFLHGLCLLCSKETMQGSKVGRYSRVFKGSSSSDSESKDELTCAK